MAAGERNVTPWQRPGRSLLEFIASDNEARDTRLSGREVFVPFAWMAWCLAALATAFGVIIEAVRTT
jgi:hypothetical protein